MQTNTNRRAGRRFDLSAFETATTSLPRHLARYAAEVDQWHREALAARVGREAG